ncbi:LCP family protein [Sporolituus thermophilus]|uniref:Transcriptional attenuator, LytR family n=1 Tax=Sporolituus thermophilus DSM 23256 TaxID=1123285 RepID=A0A1G7MY75_9FIRM|nr:LCP family protein [Sporolituus thermophilus]SDF66616.1 transcriptional attenuator, LytR family [Sporolituus thermophilus DSM 23256]
MTSRLERRLATQRKQQTKRILFVLLALFLALAVGTGSYLYFSGKFNKAKRAVGLAASHKINIAVLGVDERSDDVGRSDTLFVVSVDPDSKDVALLSIPRDTRVKTPGHGWDKINHAYAEGGHQLTLRTLEELLGIPIDYYVLINFAGFYKIVDAVGGVTIDVEKRMYYEDPYDNLVIDLKPGVQRMDGKTAIQYVRYRDAEGDLGRIERQQKFIKAMLNEVTSPLVITRVPSIIREVNSVIKTDMTTAEMLNLAKLLNDAAKHGLKTDIVPGKPAYIDDISYWLPDIVALREHVAQVQGIVMDDKYLAAAKRLAAEYEASIPREMKVVEVPKTVQPPRQAAVSPAQTPEKQPEKSAPSGQPTKPPAPAKLKVQIVNASGAPDAGTKVAAVLRSQGFDVLGIATAGQTAPNTVVTSYTTDNAVVGKLTSLPFKYVLHVTKNDAKADQVTVLVGKDYVEK